MSIEYFLSKILNSLYPAIVNPKSKVTIKFSYRFLFIAKLRQRVKRANKHIS